MYNSVFGFHIKNQSEKQPKKENILKTGEAKDSDEKSEANSCKQSLNLKQFLLEHVRRFWELVFRKMKAV